MTKDGTCTLTSGPVAISRGSTCQGAFNAGQVVTLSAVAASGSTFGGWSGACTGTGTCQVTMDAPKSVNATFNSTATRPTVLFPSAAGITLVRGEPVTLQWAGSSGTAVRIQLLKGGTVQATDIASSTSNTGSFVWTIPSAQQANTNHRIQITALTGGASYRSDNMFAITP